MSDLRKSPSYQTAALSAVSSKLSSLRKQLQGASNFDVRNPPPVLKNPGPLLDLGNIVDPKLKKELLKAICTDIGSGIGILQACKKNKLHYTTFYLWRTNSPEIEAQLQEALTEGGHKERKIRAIDVKTGVIDKVCAEIAEGTSVLTACLNNDVDPRSFYQWRKKFPILEEKYETAKRKGQHVRQSGNYVPPSDEIHRAFYKSSPKVTENDITTLTKEQLIEKYGADSVVLEYAIRAGNPNFVNGE